MRLSFATDRVLAVVAHPDDAELLCAGTLARARDDGAEIGICVLCQGDKGLPEKPVKNLAAVRKRELKSACKLLQAQLYTGDVADGTLGDDGASRRVLIEIYRKFRPTLILAHAENDYHPDHRAASCLAEAASWFCASRGHKTASPPLAAPPVLWWMDTVNMAGFEPGFFVDVTDYVELKHQLLECHTSQLQRQGDTDFAPLSELMQRQYEARGAQANTRAAEAFRLHLAWKRATAW